MIQQEEWREVIGYESILEVSTIGRVRSKERLVYFTDNKPPRVLRGSGQVSRATKYAPFVLTAILALLCIFNPL